MNTPKDLKGGCCPQPPCSGLVRMEVELRYDPDLMHGNCAESKAWFLDVLLGDSLVLHSSEIGDEVGPVKVTQILSSTHLPKCIICGGEEPCSHNFNHPNSQAQPREALS